MKFIKTWTLPLAIFSGAALYLLFALVPWLAPVAEAFAPVPDMLMPVGMFFVLFVTFCKVDFHKLRPVAWHLWVSLFNLLIVGVALGVILMFRLQGDALVLVEALLMCAIAPGATAAPIVTQKLGGSLEEQTTFTFLSNFITVLVVPVCFPLIEKGADVHFLDAAAKILREVVMVLVVPMAVAYVVKHHLPRLHRRIVGVSDLGYYLWAMLLLIVTGTTVKNIVHAQTTALFLCVIAVLAMLVCVAQFAVGRYVGHFFGRTVEAGQSLGQKNTTFAIWMACTYLTPLSSVGPGCYILWQNIINSVEIWRELKIKN